jgi:thiamine-phosphate pyrophosphorylase
MSAPLTRPVICLVTDRRRLPDPQDDSLVRLVATAADAGVTLVQVREHDLNDRQLLPLAMRIVEAAHPHAQVVINERADVARAAGADGVHLRSESVAADRVRRVAAPAFLIGRSVHGAAEARAAAASGVDYLVMGTIFTTRSKPADNELAGLSGLEETCRAVPVPVLAIGGMSLETVDDVAAAGAAGVAAIGLFAGLSAHVTPPDAVEMHRIVERIRRAFVT